MKKILPLLFALVLLLSACSSAKKVTPEPTPSLVIASSTQPAQEAGPSAPSAEPEEPVSSPETDWFELYAPVLESYEKLLKNESPYDFETAGDDPYGIADNFELYRSSMAKPGTCLADLDGNGVLELMVGLMTDDFFYSRIIAGLFTIEDGAVKTVFTSYTRSRYCLSSDGGFIYEGSGGASYSDYYHCSFSGSSLSVDYGVYSDGDRGFFYCENGGREDAAKTESFTQEQFNEYYSKLDSMISDPPEYTMLDLDS